MLRRTDWLLFVVVATIALSFASGQESRQQWQRTKRVVVCDSPYRARLPVDHPDRRRSAVGAVYGDGPRSGRRTSVASWYSSTRRTAEPAGPTHAWCLRHAPVSHVPLVR